MKKIFAIVLGVTLLAGTQANAQISVGAGWLNSTEKSVTTYNDGSKNVSEPTNLNGFYAGGQYNIPIAGGLGVAPGLYASVLFGKKTGSVSYIVGSTNLQQDYTEIALNVPVNVNYAFEIGDFKLIAYAGPNFQYGIVSNDVITTSSTTILGDGSTKDTFNHYTGQVIHSDGSSNTNADNIDRNPFNIYIGGGLVFQAGSIMVNVGYDHSILNFYKGNSNTNTSRSQIKLGVGYAF
ncbi:MAG: hypothetical protein IJR12_07600 [Bacteroidales bacterium]|nr:hypothetical protein [Bacteroidales bacterium]